LLLKSAVVKFQYTIESVEKGEGSEVFFTQISLLIL
jgi:hypothetical protein